MANEFIDVVRPDGKTVTVTQKAFDLVYKKEKYTLAEEKEDVGNEDVDFYTLSREELDKNYTIPDLTKFLKREEIDFNAKATKDDLISLIVGE